MRYVKILMAIIVSVGIAGCPDYDCNDLGRIANVPNLIKLIPIQEQYQQGDVIIMMLSIPARNEYFGNNYDLLELTRDENAQLILSAGNLLEGNNVEIITGFQGGNFNWFGVPYDSQTGKYELIVEITLDRIGSYYWQTEDTFIVDGTDCNRYRIDTNFEWTIFGEVEFEVIP